VRPVLVVQHEDSSPPALLGDYLRDAGLKLDIRRLHRGDGLPETLDGHAAIVSLGGAMHVGEEERFPFLLDERRLFDRALADKVPLLGVCLGAQQLAAAAGGGVKKRAAPEVGWYPIGMTQPDALLVGVHPSTLVFLWHRHSCVVPSDGVIVAMRDGEPQVFRVGDVAWGVQFHPEIDKRVVAAWFAEAPGVAEAAWPGGLKKLRAMTKRELYRSAMTCGLLALNFLEASGARRRARDER
jgi:GMP synthase (glutamine-hydrolysing)